MRRQRWWRWWWVPGLLGLWTGMSPAQWPEQFPKPYPKLLEHRPRPLPDRIILTWAGDPARSQSVTWRTDVSVEAGLVQLARAEDGPHFPATASTIHALTTMLKTDLGPAHYHTARFEDLQPATKYAYRVGDGVNWSEWFQFRTAGEKAEPFSFVYFGDAQNDIKSLWSRVIREAYADASRARFFIHAGDLINSAESDAEWGEWHLGGGWLNATVPSVPVPGNHEYTTLTRISHHWRPQFALPEHGPPGLEETVYTFDYQGVRIVALNSNEQLEEQAAWLDGVLKNQPQRWTILTFHHPLYSSAGRDNPHIRAAWQPVIDRHRVDLVLQGHDHTYARSGLLTGENAGIGLGLREPKSGTVYAVSVSGPKMYGVQREDWMKRATQDKQLYQVIRVDGDRLSSETRTATGELFDAFELIKRDGLANELVEKLPADPEQPAPRSQARTAVIAVAALVLVGLVLLMLRAARRSVRRRPEPDSP